MAFVKNGGNCRDSQRVALVGSSRVCRSEAERILKFLLVGLGTFVVYTSMLAVLIERLGLSIIVATAAAFGVGTAISLVGNSVVVFRSPIRAQNSARFVAVTLLGFAVNLLLAWSLDRLGVHYTVIAVAIFSIVPAMNYILHRLWTFRGPATFTVAGE